MTEDACKVCGLRQDQLPPVARYNNADGTMACLHPFGVPAANVPDWREGRAPMWMTSFGPLYGGEMPRLPVTKPEV